MTMDLSDLADHIARVRDDLESKKAIMDRLLLADPASGMEIRYHIDCLEPRLRELERQALRMTKEREARVSHDRVAGHSVDHGTGPIPMVI